MERQQLWDACVEFHGHACPGLAIGFVAALGLLEAHGMEPGSSPDEELVCVTENDACGVDAIQYILGTTAGKGNLIVERKGKMAFTLYDRRGERAYRAYLVARADGMDRKRFLQYLLEEPAEKIFDITEAPYVAPAHAYRYPNHDCASCGESTAEYALRPIDGELLCMDCFANRERATFS